LFFSVARGKAITLSSIGVIKYVSFVERKAIWRHFVGRRNPHAISYIVFKAGMERRLPQTNKKIRGTWRKEGCQAFHTVASIMFSTIAS